MLDKIRATLAGGGEGSRSCMGMLRLPDHAPHGNRYDLHQHSSAGRRLVGRPALRRIPDRAGYELEDILPHDIIESAYKSAFGEVIPDVQTHFALEGEKLSSTQASEFAGRLGMGGEEIRTIDRAFKRISQEMILAKLAEIKKGKKLEDKLDQFKTAFPDYYAFIEALVVANGKGATATANDG